MIETSIFCCYFRKQYFWEWSTLSFLKGYNHTEVQVGKKCFRLFNGLSVTHSTCAWFSEWDEVPSAEPKMKDLDRLIPGALKLSSSGLFALGWDCCMGRSVWPLQSSGLPPANFSGHFPWPLNLLDTMITVNKITGTEEPAQEIRDSSIVFRNWKLMYQTVNTNTFWDYLTDYISTISILGWTMMTQPY